MTIKVMYEVDQRVSNHGVSIHKKYKHRIDQIAIIAKCKKAAVVSMILDRYYQKHIKGFQKNPETFQPECYKYTKYEMYGISIMYRWKKILKELEGTICIRENDILNLAMKEYFHEPIRGKREKKLRLKKYSYDLETRREEIMKSKRL